MDVQLHSVAKYFWDCDFSSLTWQQHRNFIIRRLLQHGDLQALCWLRAQISDSELRNWFISHQARGFSPRQIRYWSLMLDIEPALANQWVKTARDSTWEKRR